MDSVYKELDEVKVELEKLREECRVKTELSQSLRKSHDDQLAKHEQAKLQVEKLTKELSSKAEEEAEARQLYEDVKSKLLETSSSLKQANSMSEKLRVDCIEKVNKLEGEKRNLASALDEATLKNSELERQLSACSEEIEGLKRLLADSERKCAEAEKRTEVKRELRVREDAILQLEEQSMSVQEQLKWKKEQFGHLEEAHRVLLTQFRSSKQEWAKEKSDLLQEISSLQTSLDSKIREMENLQRELTRCNQALAHEESRRRVLEAQLLESKLCLDNVLVECNEAKAKIESLSLERDEEVATLRSTLGMKRSVIKDLEYRVSHLELDNKELLQTVKELQEAQIGRKRADPSAIKLRNKLRDLEQEKSSFSVKLKEREAEWSSKMEGMMIDLDNSVRELKTKSEQIHRLEMQLEYCRSSIEVLSEEKSILFTVLKSEFSEACSFNPCTSKPPSEEGKNQREEEVKIAPEKAGEEMASLAKKLKYMDVLEEKNSLLENKADKYKKMLDEYSTCQIYLKNQALLMEASVKEISDSLEKSKSELASKMLEVSQKETEVQMWKSEASSMRKSIEEKQEMSEQMKKTLLAQAEIEQSLRASNKDLISSLKEQDVRAKDLQEQIVFLNKKLADIIESNQAMKVQIDESQSREEHYLQLVEARDTAIAELQKEKVVQEAKKRESLAGDLARSEAQKVLKLEIEELRQTVNQKDRDIAGLQDIASAMEQKLMDAFISSFSETTEMLIEIDALREAILLANVEVEEKNNLICKLEELRQTVNQKDRDIAGLQDMASAMEQKLVDALISSFSETTEKLVEIDALREAISLANVEVEEKNNLICKLQRKVSDLCGKVALGEESLICSEQRAAELEVLLEKRKMEAEKLVSELEDKQGHFIKQVKELELSKQGLHDEIRKLSLERESLLVWIQQVDKQFGEICNKDASVMEALGRILPRLEDTDATAPDAVVTDKLHDPSSVDNISICKIKEVEANAGKRSPLRVVNN